MDISFEALNAMLDSWSTEELSIFTMNPYEFQFAAGQKDYTLGAGGDWDTARPMELQRMYVMYLDGGGSCAAPTPPPAAGYQNYCTFVCRNGYDGDVGIYGYITESNPFYSPFEVVVTNHSQTYPDVTTTYDNLTAGHDPIPFITIGLGEIANLPGSVGPAIVGANRSLAIPIGGYLQFQYYLPMKLGDRLWCVGTQFLGYGQAFNVTMVVGPDANNGEQYVCSGSDVEPGAAAIYIERLANVGVR